MTTRKHNEFLDIASDSDEDRDAGYDSEAAEESKGRTTKRRKTQTRGDDLETGSEGEESGSDAEEGSDDESGGVRLSGKKQAKTQADEEDRDELEDSADEVDGDQYLEVDAEPSKSAKTKKASKPINTDKLKAKPKKNKTGVVYLSSLPPYMKPFALKSMLEARGFGPITKVFLSPEVRPSSAPKRRSNKRKTYSDGWVEFASKKMAKICAESMNASIMGGKKGGWYHDDVLNIKYLKNFKWADLTEQIERERNEREAKRRIEDTRARKEEKVFLQGYEKGKMLEGIQKKNEEKRKRKMQAGGGDEDRSRSANVRRTFQQSEVKHGRDKISDAQGAVEEDTKRVLGKIF